MTIADATMETIEVHGGRAEAHAPWAHMLVALDGSETAEQVLPYVISAARTHGSHVTLLSVAAPLDGLFVRQIPVASQALGAGLAALTPVKERRRSALEYLSRVGEALQVEGIPVQIECPDGQSAAEVIVRYARRHGVDVIALSAHGNGLIRDRTFGPVAEEVLRSAHCAVLLIKPDR